MKTSFKNTVAAGLVAVSLLFSAACSRGENARTAGQSVDDTAITAKVKTAFAKDPTVKAIDVKVDTFKGTVQLNGWVNSEADKARAEEVAKTVPGVVTVDNKLSIKTDVTKKTP
jgi:osmotically-inducible protein OsmY